MDRYKLERTVAQMIPPHHEGHVEVSIRYKYGEGYEHVANIFGSLYYEDAMSNPAISPDMERVLSLLKGALEDSGFSIKIGIKPVYTIFDLVEVDDDDES